MVKRGIFGFGGGCVVLVLLVISAGVCFAADVGAGDEVPIAEQKEMSLWSTIAAGGIIGYVIILTSLVVVALIIENFVSVRRKKFLPDGLAGTLKEHFKADDYAKAREVCVESESFLGHVVNAGLAHVEALFGFFDMQNAMQESSERIISKQYRKLEYLSFIGAAAPIMGLLGTVTGMIKAFNQIALTEGAAKPSQLAGGISEALVTTCLGLIVALPAMFFVTFFRNRIDSYVAEAEVTVDKLMRKFRKTEPAKNS